MSINLWFLLTLLVGLVLVFVLVKWGLKQKALAKYRAIVLKWEIKKIGIDSADAVELLAHAICQKTKSKDMGVFWLMSNGRLAICPKGVVDRMPYEGYQNDKYYWALDQAVNFQHRKADKLLRLRFDQEKKEAFVEVLASRFQPQPAVTTAIAE